MWANAVWGLLGIGVACLLALAAPQMRYSAARKVLAVLAGLFLISGVLVWWFGHEEQSKPAAVVATGQSVGQQNAQSITNNFGDPANAPETAAQVAQTAPPTIPSQPVCSDTTLSNCAQINYGTQSINGYVPPPKRVMTQENALAAIALLKTAPIGSRVHFMRIGRTDEDEVERLFHQIYGVFMSTDGVWHVEADWAQASVGPNSEGIGCSISSAPSKAGKIAEKAMKAAGFPCAHESLDGMRHGASVDVDISVGTRIVPPK
jgi:hypothetical protein